MDKKNDNKKKSGIALALWILVALGLLIFFLVEQDKIFSNLKQSDFFGKVFGKTPEFIENHEVKEESSKGKNDVAPISIEIAEQNTNSDKEITIPVSPINEKAAEETAKTSAQKEEEAKKEKTKKDTADKSINKSTEKNKETKTQSPAANATMNIKLCFIEVGSDGSVSEKVITRKMPKSDSPLVDSINAIIKGPTLEEEKSGCKSYIPKTSRILGASIKNGVATINFNENFEFDQNYGTDGRLAQLKQVVYTATAFSTVSSVQFLIEGEHKEYLGSEGVWIGSPLTRTSFN